MGSINPMISRVSRENFLVLCPMTFSTNDGNKLEASESDAIPQICNPLSKMLSLTCSFSHCYAKDKGMSKEHEKTEPES